MGLLPDDEKQLRRMDAWQLATVIHEESIRKTAPEKRIVAEHMLNVRLEKYKLAPRTFQLLLAWSVLLVEHS